MELVGYISNNGSDEITAKNHTNDVFNDIALFKNLFSEVESGQRGTETIGGTEYDVVRSNRFGSDSDAAINGTSVYERLPVKNPSEHPEGRYVAYKHKVIRVVLQRETNE